MAATLSFMRAVVLEQKERTNKCPKAVVERLIEESESRIASLESQISALVDLRDRERGCVAALRHIISPIHILPVELLAEIFELSIRSDYQQVEDVFRISQVCSDWRQVAHSTSRLWIRPLYIDLRPGKSTDGEGYAEGLKTWFLRSTPLAIPVSFILDYHHVDCRIPDGVLSTAPRWRSLRLNVSSYTPPPFVRQLAEGRFDSLEELNLGLLKIDEGDTAPSFTTVPRLQKLRMNVGSHALPILVPWHQLTDLTLRTRFPNIALDILGQCTNLIQADVGTTGWDVLPEAREIVHCSHLRTLDLGFLEAGEHLLLFLDCLSTPALEELHLNFGAMGIEARWTQARFTAFQLRAPSITQLDFQDSSLTSDDLRTAICYTPSLTHLKLTRCDNCIDDSLINALSYKAGVRILAPHLHHLSLDEIGNNFTENILAGMIASRWWTDAELASRSVPPVARWTRVRLYGFSKQFVNMLKDLLSDVLILL